MTISVVIVDDSRADRYIAKRIVEESAAGDVKLIEYETGDDFVETIKDQQRRSEELGEPPPPILVFLDINMPGMSGFDVLDAIENLIADSTIMIVTMYSSSSHAGDRADAQRYGFVKDYVVKPITKERCEELFRKHYSMD